MKTVFAFPAFLFLILVPSFVDGVEFPRLLTLILLILVLIIFKPNLLLVSNKMLYLPILLPITMLFSSFFNRQDLLGSLFGKQGRNFGVLLYLFLAILVIVTSKSNLRNSRPLFLYSVLPVTVFSIFYGSIQVLGNDFLVWGEKDRVVLTLGNSNFAAGYLALLVPGSLYGIFAYRSKIVRTLSACSLLYLTFIGIKTISFQFYVLTFVSLLSFLAIAKYDSIYRISKTIKYFISFSLIGIFLIIIKFNLDTFDDLTNAADRLAQQRSGLMIFSDYPLFGVGVDNLNRFMPQYLYPSDIRREGYYNNPDRTHNSIIDLLANNGIFAGLLYASFIVYIFFIIKRLVSLNRIDKKEIALPASIFFTYFAQGFINTDSILNMILPYVAIGVLLALQNQTDEKVLKLALPSKNLFAIRSIFLVVLICLLIITPRAIKSEITTKNVLISERITEKDVMNAVTLWPDRENIEKVLVGLAQEISNCPVTLKVADRLLAVDNMNGQAWYVKAICVDSKGEIELAMKFVEKALQFQPLNPTFLSGMIQLQEALNLNTEAKKTKVLLDSLAIK